MDKLIRLNKILYKFLGIVLLVLISIAILLIIIYHTNNDFKTLVDSYWLMFKYMGI